MQTINEQLLRDLAGYDALPCISLFLDTTAGGGDHRHIGISLKNAKLEAARLVDAAAFADAEAVAAVKDRLDALRYDDVMGGHDRRVAVFIGPDLTEVVAARCDATGAHVGARFRLAPLVGGLECTPDHAILVASREDARLYRASGGSLTRQEVDDMPTALSDVSRFTDEQEKGNIHGREDSGIPGSYAGARAAATAPAGPQGVPHHSMGGHDWRGEHEKDLQDYANLLIKAAGHHLSGSNVPLVVAADERLHGMIRENSEYPFLAEEGIFRHPKEMDEDALRDEAAACLAGAAARRRDAAWDKVARSLGRDDHEASLDPVDIATAAAAGRIADLFVREGAALRGRLDDRTLAAAIDENGPEDLVDRAIAETLRNRGNVFPLGDRGGDDTLMAASYRYPA